MTPHEQYGGMLVIVLDSAETPEVFCGLNHFTHPSIGRVVSR